MKRELTALLAVALIGSLFVVGFAGTAAAAEDDGGDSGSSAVAVVDQDQDVTQVNAVNQELEQEAEQEGSENEVNVVITEENDFPPGPPDNVPPVAAQQNAQQNDQQLPDGLTVEIGHSDQTITQTGVQIAEAENENEQTGTAVAVND